MLCNRCGVKIEDGVRYCDNCNDVLARQGAVSPSNKRKHRLSTSSRSRLLTLLILSGALLVSCLIAGIGYSLTRYEITRDGNKLVIKSHFFGADSSEYMIKEPFSFNGNLLYWDDLGFRGVTVFGANYGFILLDKAIFQQLIRDFKNEGLFYPSNGPERKLNINRCKSSGFINANNKQIMAISSDPEFKEKVESLNLYEGIPITITGSRIVSSYRDRDGRLIESDGGNVRVLVDSIKTENKSISLK